MSDTYILDGKRAVKCNDLSTWGRWYETAKRQVDNTVIGEARVSTVFLGLNHQYGEGPPLLFETMIFGGPHDEYQDRYSTWDQAETGHKHVVAALKAGEEP